METGDRERESWRLVIGRERELETGDRERELETGDRERESWRLVIGRERVGDW